ncbi:hypothetical protein RIF29_23267 [Crotalaria pallida]|uniref:Uncharacterized protein n=1 Tax=Crotalaria pallida TaxID=3830 RepID=A0AAN9F5W7_CROPI
MGSEKEIKQHHRCPNSYWLCAATEQSIKIRDLESKSIVEYLKVDLKTEVDATGGGMSNKKKSPRTRNRIENDTYKYKYSERENTVVAALLLLSQFLFHT